LRQDSYARGLLERALDAGAAQLGSSIPLFHRDELVLCAPVYAGARKSGSTSMCRRCPLERTWCAWRVRALQRRVG
ncbi:MAG: hypothetical protein AAGN64_16320, partial [Bacteroidota bacterium]